MSFNDSIINKDKAALVAALSITNPLIYSLNNTVVVHFHLAFWTPENAPLQFYLIPILYIFFLEYRCMSSYA